MNQNIFAQFDTKKLPLVNVKTYKNIDKSSYSKFIEDWQNIYKEKKYYYLIIDTSSTGLINIKYALKVSRFIKNLRNNGHKIYGNQWLQFSIFIVKNKFVMNLLNIIFRITRPIAPVYIVNDFSTKNYILENLEQYDLENYSKNIAIFKSINKILFKNRVNFKFIDSMTGNILLLN
jgi:hypothetical protein